MKFYNPPVDENGNEYYVPIVAKNKDYLLGYIDGVDTAKDILSDISSYVNDINIDLHDMDIVLDSTRFNDILENGMIESNMTGEELHKYFYDIVNTISEKYLNDTSENNILRDDVLHVECVCPTGYFSWKDYESIPDKTFRCPDCGRVLIHYTDENTYEYSFKEYGENYD